jgi:hypothetical protein
MKSKSVRMTDTMNAKCKKKMKKTLIRVGGYAPPHFFWN